MVKESILYPDYRLLLTNKKEQTIDTRSNLAEFSENYVSEKKVDLKRLLQDSIFNRILK